MTAPSEWEARARETYEQRLNRLFGNWTDAEVFNTFTVLRDAKDAPKGLNAMTFDTLWREYARRTFPENIACKRCGSDNHTMENHV